MKFQDVACVRDMQFADLYLGHPTLGARFTDVPGTKVNPVPAGPKLLEDLKSLLAVCEATYREHQCAEYRLEYDRGTYRVTVVNAAAGSVYVLRRVPLSLRTLMEMGMPAIYARQLLREDLTGLVVIAGKMNSGKTTTAGCVISERLIAYGGVAITAEDPIELPLEGQHGPGMCLQTHADKDRGGYETACTSIMRSGANIILLGEILSGEIAVEALRAGMNGHLILTTLHADDIQTCLRRLVSLVTHMYPPEAAQAIMADGLAAVVHQSLEGSPRRLANVAMLNVKGSCAAVNIVRSGRFELLSAEVDLQMARMIRSVRE